MLLGDIVLAGKCQPPEAKKHQHCACQADHLTEGPDSGRFTPWFRLCEMSWQEVGQGRQMFWDAALCSPIVLAL